MKMSICLSYKQQSGKKIPKRIIVNSLETSFFFLEDFFLNNLIFQEMTQLLKQSLISLEAICALLSNKSLSMVFEGEYWVIVLYKGPPHHSV